MRHTEIVNESNSDFHPWWSQILVSNGDFELIIMAFVGIWNVSIPNKYIINDGICWNLVCERTKQIYHK